MFKTGADGLNGATLALARLLLQHHLFDLDTENDAKISTLFLSLWKTFLEVGEKRKSACGIVFRRGGHRLEPHLFYDEIPKISARNPKKKRKRKSVCGIVFRHGRAPARAPSDAASGEG